MVGLALLALAALPCGEPLVDSRDGRSYPTVRIGDLCWMARNLDHGAVVPDGVPRDAAHVEKSCYGNDPESCRVYGGLYTWDEARASCPAGWHLPTRGEWEVLATHLGAATAGERLKARKDHVPPFDGTDDVGFTALAGGTVYRGAFGRQGHWAVFWTATESGRERAVSATLDRFWYPEPPRYRSIVFDTAYLKENGFSVRCALGTGAARTRGNRAAAPDVGAVSEGPIRAGGTPSAQKRQANGRPSSGPYQRESSARSAAPATLRAVQRAVHRPNILCVVCEDISPLLGSYGDPVAFTPVLDRLAREGVRFTRMFSSSGVCAPSRAALITGMYASAIGADNMRTSSADRVGLPPYEAVPPAAVRPFSELLRAAGYYATNNAKTDYQFAPPLTAWDENGRDAHWRHRPPGMPFFSVFNIETTHESQVWDRANDPAVLPPERVLLPPYFPDTPLVRRDVARVYANVAVMDRQVGELLAELEEAGLARETVVIFYSDNGGPLPRGKRELLDSGLHVPFLMRLPDGSHAGTTVDDLVAFVDIPATILSLAGVPVPSDMQGRPFWGAQKASTRDFVFAARDRMDEEVDHVRAVRDTRFEYLRNYRPDLPRYQDIDYRKQMAAMQEILRLRDEGKLDAVQSLWFEPTKPAEELYDTEADPHEVHDLAGDPAYRPQLERLRAALDAWLREIGDRPDRPEAELLEAMWPGRVQPKTAPPAIAWRDGRVAIACPTPGSAVAYQVDGRGLRPGHWLLYTGPFDARPGSVVTAAANRVGYAPSGEVRFVVP
jgi:N-sulfoglucosamine sulfohydrolase